MEGVYGIKVCPEILVFEQKVLKKNLYEKKVYIDTNGDEEFQDGKNYFCNGK